MDKPPATPEPPQGRRRYQWTLLLFAIVAAAAVVWFQRHIKPFVTESLIIGGTISLWGLWKLVWSQFEFGGGEKREDFTRRLLANPGATRALYFAALIVTLLHLTTSSIYLRVAGVGPGESRFTVRVLEHGEVIMGPYEMQPGKTLGAPIVPSLRTRELVYEIDDPRGFRTLTKTLPPWGAHDVSVPGSFERKRLNFVVIVPDAALYADLPRRSEPGGDRYYLEATFDGKTALLENYSRELVVTGAAKEDLPGEKAVTLDPQVRDVVNDYLSQANIQDPDAVAGELFDTGIKPLDSTEFASGAQLDIAVGIWEGAVKGPKQILFTCRLTVPGERGYHTIVIGVTQGSLCKPHSN